MEEIWKDVIGYEGFYQVSNTGKVINIKKNKHLLPDPNSQGYLRVTLKYNESKRYFIHRLVAIHFVENPKGFDIINHIDQNFLNNYTENLEWCTRSHNIKECIKAGKMTGFTGARNARSKRIFDPTTGEIYVNGVEAAKRIGCCVKHLYAIMYGAKKNRRGLYYLAAGAVSAAD